MDSRKLQIETCLHQSTIISTHLLTVGPPPGGANVAGALNLMPLMAEERAPIRASGYFIHAPVLLISVQLQFSTYIH